MLVTGEMAVRYTSYLTLNKQIYFLNKSVKNENIEVTH